MYIYQGFLSPAAWFLFDEGGRLTQTGPMGSCLVFTMSSPHPRPVDEEEEGEERPQKRARTDLGDMLRERLQQATGIVAGMTVIDVDPAKDLPKENRPLENGVLQDPNGKVLPASTRADFVNAYYARISVIEKNPDYKFLTILGGQLNTTIEALIDQQEWSTMKMAETELHKELEQQRKVKFMDVAARQKIIQELDAQIITNKQDINQLTRVHRCVGPTVNRWECLASVTGFVSSGEPPTPFWLLHRIRADHAPAAMSKLDIADDANYWDWTSTFPYIHSKFEKAQTNRMTQSNDELRNRTIQFYLFLRDTFLPPALRLKSDMGIQSTVGMNVKTMCSRVNAFIKRAVTLPGPNAYDNASLVFDGTPIPSDLRIPHEDAADPPGPPIDTDLFESDVYAIVAQLVTSNKVAPNTFHDMTPSETSNGVSIRSIRINASHPPVFSYMLDGSNVVYDTNDIRFILGLKGWFDLFFDNYVTNNRHISTSLDYWATKNEQVFDMAIATLAQLDDPLQNNRKMRLALQWTREMMRSTINPNMSLRRENPLKTMDAQSALFGVADLIECYQAYFIRPPPPPPSSGRIQAFIMRPVNPNDSNPPAMTLVAQPRQRTIPTWTDVFTDVFAGLSSLSGVLFPAHLWTIDDMSLTRLSNVSDTVNMHFQHPPLPFDDDVFPGKMSFLVRLLRVMVVFERDFYAKETARLHTITTSLDKTRQEAKKAIEEIATSDYAKATKDIEKFIKDTFQESTSWALQPFLSGRLRLTQDVTAALAQAFALLQNLARDLWVNGAIPSQDVLTGNTRQDVNRDYLDTKHCSPLHVQSLATDFATLVATLMFKAKQRHNRTYFTARQNSMAVMDEKNACLRFLRYRVRQLTKHAYTVDYQ